MNHRQPRNLADALNLFAFQRGQTKADGPDYAGFSIWFGNTLEELRADAGLPMRVSPTTAHALALFSDLAAAAKRFGITVGNEELTFSDQAPALKKGARGIKLKPLNKLKLLTFLFRSMDRRMREVVVDLPVMLETRSIPSSVPAIASQSHHRWAFFAAVANKDERTAFKMLGRLREDEHHVGEIDFLEAVALFHSNRFREAIASARKVPAEAIDALRSRLLILESLAWLGDIPTIVLEDSARLLPDWPAFFMRYVCQVALANSTEPEQYFSLVQRFSGDALSGASRTGYFATWNRNSCQMAVEYVELQKERQLRDAAVGQGAMESASRSASADTNPRNLRMQQLGIALRLDPELRRALGAASLSEEYREVVKRLLNYHEPEFEDFRLALMTQWRIGNRTVFLDNVLSNLPSVLLGPADSKWPILELAFQEAVAQERGDDAAKIHGLLSSWPAFADRRDKVADTALSARLERRLSPMGKLAFRAVKQDIANAETGSHRWKDAGMISLGFFRILELEMNERLIFPLKHNLDAQQLQAAYDALGESCRDSDEKDQLRRKAKNFWERMLPALFKATSPQRIGLQLGTMEILLSKTGVIAGLDASVKKIINAGICASLTPDGAEAYRSGELANQINSAVREKFRNPPAHTRFLDVATAKECSLYVEGVLTRLDKWTKPRTLPPSD